MNEVKRQLKSIRNVNGLANPDSVWVSQNRARLLQQINNTVTPVEKLTVVNSIQAVWFQLRSSHAFQTMRPTLTALGIAVMATGGWIASVSASYNSLPGDRLWIVKRVAQNTEIAVKSFGASDQQKVQLRLDLAKSRVDDIKKTVIQKLSSDSNKEENKDEKAKTVKDLNVAVQDVQDAVKSVSDTVTNQAKTTSKDNPQQVVDTVKDVARGTNDIAKTLVSTVASSTVAGGDVTKQVLETVKVVNQTSINAVEAVVQQQDQVSKVGETNTVKNIVSEKVVDLVKNTEAMKEDLRTSLGIPTDPSKTVSSTPTNSITLTIPTATGTTSIVLPDGKDKANSLEKIVSANTSTSTTVPVTLLQQADKQTSDVHDSAAEIKKKIDDGNLQGAVNQLRDLNNSAVNTQQILAETKKQVQDTRTK